MSIESRIGISTHSLPGISLEEGIEEVRKSGFSVFELVPSDSQGVVGYPTLINAGIWPRSLGKEERKKLKESLSYFKQVTIHSAHLDLNIASFNRGIREESKKQYLECIELAKDLEVKIVTFHTGKSTGSLKGHKEKILEYELEFARESIDLAEDYNIQLGFEVCKPLGDMQTLISAIDSPRIGLNLDFSHAAKSTCMTYSAGQKTGFGNTDHVLEWIEAFRDKIVEVHVHGLYCGWWDMMLGHQPLERSNMLDYSRLMQAMKKINYNGPFIFEIQSIDVKTVISDCLKAKEMIIDFWNK